MSDSKVKPFEPDRWLICSRTAFQSIVGHWSEEAGAGSLLQWRLVNGLIEHVDVDDLTTRLTRMAAERGGCAAVTFDDVNETQLSLIEAMPDSIRERLDLRLIDWRSSPFDAVVGMNSPDRVLLQRLQGNEKYHGFPPPPSLGNLSGPTDWHGYHTALLAWESGCRASHPDDFAAAYPNFASTPINWHALAFGAPLPVAANDDDWIFVGSAAAGWEPEDNTPFRLEAPADSPDRWDLAWAPKDGGPSGFLIFTCHPASTGSLIGCRVRVKSDAEIFDLGIVEDDGIAEIQLGERVDVGNVWVSISRLDAD